MRYACLLFLALFGCLEGAKPVALIENPCLRYTLVNSVEFHPKKPVFIVTYSQGAKVVLYTIDPEGDVRVLQTLENPDALLRSPQHASFSPDGNMVVVANWRDQTVAFYNVLQDGSYANQPEKVFQIPEALKNCKPHGISISPDAKFLAIAYGAGSEYERALALYDFATFQLLDFLKVPDRIPGTPKGITFTPDSRALLVTYADQNSLVLYDIDAKHKKIVEKPRQIIQGHDSGIVRPEDVKISRDGRFVAISNSEGDTVTFYPFDKAKNLIVDQTPSYILQNPEADLIFPHGVAFSADGLYLAVTQFGKIRTKSDGNILWDKSWPKEMARVTLYRVAEALSESRESPQ